jgi:hypothetical protein
MQTMLKPVKTEKGVGIRRRLATQILMKIKRGRVVERNRGKMMRKIRIKQTNPVPLVHGKNGTKLIPQPPKC